MKREIAPKVKIVMSRAFDEAKAYNAVKLRPEHIVLSILTDDNNRCVDVLINMGVDLYALHDKISEHLKLSDLSPRIESNRKLNIPPSEITKEIFNSVDEECANLNDDAIDTAHIMLSILKLNTVTRQILNEMGIYYEEFLKMITEIKLNEEMIRNIENSYDEPSDFEYEGPSDDSDRNRKKNTNSKTPVLDNFCRDITKAAEEDLLDPV
nr:hypothetical protein [Candidatus Dadabacteria bacterium]